MYADRRIVACMLRNSVGGALLAFFAAGLAAGDVLVVPLDYPTIQAAVDAAVDGDIIEVEPGTYFEAVSIENKSLDIVGVGGADITTIDATGIDAPAVTAEAAVAAVVSLEGLLITGGGGRPDGATRTVGGGVLASRVDLTLQSCRIEQNSAHGEAGGPGADGAGLFVTKGAVSAFDSTINTNTVLGSGEGDSNCGAFHLRLCDRVEFVGCDVVGNLGGPQQAIGWFEECSELFLTDCRFAANSSSTTDVEGGLLVTGPHALLTDCIYRAHHVAGYGHMELTIDVTGAVVENSIFQLNNFGDVGAVRALGVTFIECEFADNTCFDGGGGGLRGTAVTVIGCVFNDNLASFHGGDQYYGNGGAFQGSGDFFDCEFDGNGAEWCGGAAYGGRFFDCRFVNNSSHINAGAVRTVSSLIVGCLFLGNNASAQATAVRAENDLLLYDCTFGGHGHTFNVPVVNVENTATAINTVFAWNTGSNAAAAGVLQAGVSAHIVNCSLIGSVLRTGGELVIDNSILRRGEMGTGPLVVGNDVTIRSSNVEGGADGVTAATVLWGPGNIVADPLFVAPLGADGVAGTEDDDLRLLPGSPCIDAGGNELVLADSLDRDGDGDVLEPWPLDRGGNERFVDDHYTADTGIGTGSIVDIGAWEYEGGEPACLSPDCDGDGVPNHCPPDCNGNGLQDSCDLASGTSHDVNDDGVPDECQCLGDVNGDGRIDVADVKSLLLGWGSCGDCSTCGSDVTADCQVDVLDLLAVLSNWGVCQ